MFPICGLPSPDQVDCERRYWQQEEGKENTNDLTETLGCDYKHTGCDNGNDDSVDPEDPHLLAAKNRGLVFMLHHRI
jgi:hypothetical protein